MMKLLSTVLACALVFGAFDAEAKRMGGGGSMGRQSSNVTQRQATPPAAPAQTPAQAAPGQRAAPAAGAAAAAPRRPWMGMLGGLAAGLGLAWLASSLGLGAGFGNILLILLLAVGAFLLFRLFMRSRQQPAAAQKNSPFAFQGAGGDATQAGTLPQYNPSKVGNDASARPWESGNASFEASAPRTGGSSMLGSAIGAGVGATASPLAGSQSWGVPAGFDVEGFLTAAKRNFVTLQDAWDRSDISALRAMMTDSMLSEIRSQLAERESHSAGKPNKTEVVMLDAQLLGIEEDADGYLASVEFSGMIREDASAGPSPFREVWNMAKPRNGQSGWLVAGVQALQ
jgi:predicted lipid-binding transport protein (Tim44 family)